MFDSRQFLTGNLRRACVPLRMARRWRWHGYAWAVAAAASCTLIGVAMQPRFDVVNIAMVYLLAVVVIALRFARGPAVTASVLCVAAFDFMFVQWYLMKFVGDSPFSHSALDIRTFAMAVLRIDYAQSTKKNMPRRWFDDFPHTHIALDDAIEQGALFCNMLKESRS